MPRNPNAVRKSSTPGRRLRAVETFRNVAESLGPLTPGCNIFAITRGQWSMIDAVLYTMDQIQHAGPVTLSLWTWTVAEYEIETLTRLMADRRIAAGRLIIDYSARIKNAAIIAQWQKTFGADSTRYVLNHAKLATVANAAGRYTLRGSMNLNFNPRFEQFDLSEGPDHYQLVRAIEDELPILANDAPIAEIYAATKLTEAWSPGQLQLFPVPAQTWQPNPRTK